MNFDFPSEPAIHQFDDYILQKGENVNDKVQKNLFVKLDVSKTNCFTGQPLLRLINYIQDYVRIRCYANSFI